MQNDDERRRIELELKISDLDDWIERLNAQVYRQQLMIDQLAQEVARLSSRWDEHQPHAVRHVRDELPPHY